MELMNTLSATGLKASWPPAKAAYTLLMAVCLLSFLPMMAVNTGIDTISPYLWIARITAGFLAVWLGKLWKNKGFWILTAYTLLIFLRVWLEKPENLFQAEVAENLLSAIWIFGACYGLGFILGGKQLKHFLFLCAAVWTAGIVVFSCIGIYTVWTDRPIPIERDGLIGLYGARLDIVYLATTTGSFLEITALIALICAITVKNRIGKTLFLLALFPVFLAIALTDSRTAFVSVSAGIGVLVFVTMFRAVQKRDSEKTKAGSLKPWLIAVPAMFLTFFLILFLIQKVTPVFNHLKLRGLIPVAYAEERGGEAVVTRGFTGGPQILTGRFELWTDVMKHIQSHPMTLLIGESKLAPTRSFNDYYAHCHCIYLQVLLESGIPGLLLLLAFILYTFTHNIRAVKHKTTPIWIALLTALPISLWVGDIVETFTWLRSSQCPMGAILFIAAGVICSGAANHIGAAG